MLSSVAAAVMGWPASAAAQFPDLFEVSGQYIPGADVEGAGPTEAQVASYDAAINVPLTLEEDSTYLIVGAGYHSDSISFSNAPPGFIDLRSFHSIEVSLLLVQLLPDDWSLSFLLAPGLAGDLRGIDGDMLRLNSMVMATYVFSDAFVLGGGLLTTYGFGVLLPLPTLYLEYRPASSVRIEAFLPAFTTVQWSLGNRVELGLRAELQGNEYAVRDGRIADAFPCRGAAVDDPATPFDERARNADACLDHFAYSVGSAGATLGVRLWGSVWLTAFGGYTLFRRFDPKNATSDTLPDGGNDLANDFVLRTSLAWRVPTGE